MRKINQSYEYCEDQINFLKEVFTKPGRLKDFDQDSIEKQFEERFGIKRTFSALLGKAKKEGFRPKKSTLQVGVSRKRSRDSDCDMILASLNPVRYTPVNRYVWETSTGETLSKDDVIINLNGIEYYPKIDTLRKVTRGEHLAINSMDDDIPLETRILLAQVTSRVATLEGRGEWTDEEKEWVLKHGKRKGGRGFWINLTEKFNNIFNKNRTNRCLLMMFYQKGDSK